MTPYPFQFDGIPSPGYNGENTKANRHPICRGRTPSSLASRLRTILYEAHADPTKIVATCCSDDGLGSHLVEEAGFPCVFLGGFMVASSFGLPDTGYIAFQEMAIRIQEVRRQVSIPIIADGDTGYGSPVNVKRVVQGFALAGAAVVSREEAFARVQAAVDARNEGVDIVVIGRTDSLILGWDEAIYRAKKFIEIGVDLIFIEAIPDRETMKKTVDTLNFPTLANIIEGGLTQQLSAQELGQIGFSIVAYPFTMVAAKVKAVREALDILKASFTSGAPPRIMSFEEVCEAVGFDKYWELEEKYKY
ncbi:methylisocitrate lyase [Trichoderma arundinaceum]|uniref:Methylisocitrate lyase n=1 Tax=Trichoderma arundinaceum TaxID=490622 RepID=A0A395NVA9_TRIAR|nr:methylisocitrate lyase [Trichoderma arundinaceum]